MMEHEHHDEPSGVDKSAVLAQLDQRHQNAREQRRAEHEQRAKTRVAEAEEMLRGLNRGEPVEKAADPPPESVEIHPLQDVPDDELDLGSIADIVEARRRGDWRALTSGERATRLVRSVCVGRRVPVRSRGRREHRPGQRRTASASRADPGGGDSDEPDPPSAAGPGDGDWLACADLSAAEPRWEAARSAPAYAGPLGRRRRREHHLGMAHAGAEGGPR